ncbi:MAG: 4Fe-4S dicluster domain-containing protein [Desulfobacteraceae bacterium]|nr:MAG: 4Fe-4S dicluster domain-containing protein [Desulfobacteraceae bacterium]
MDTSRALAEKFSDVEMFRACEQCGCCSSACPITGVDGFNIRRIIRHIELDLVNEIADTPFPWACTTCGRCESVCPNGIAILDIIRPLRSVSPDEFVPDEAPCIKACPGGIDVPGYVRLIAQGKAGDAYALIREKVPFPGVLGRVCPHPCEDACKRGEVNMPIAICALKRYAADNETGSWREALRVADDTGHKVAVIGAGPAGLTAGFYLRKKGHGVTIFEALPEPGGMMRFGIPEYRLPKDILMAEIKEIEDIGVEIRTNTRSASIEKLFEEGYNAVFLAIGEHQGLSIGVDGEDSPEVIEGVTFLREVSLGKKVELGSRVAVIGGGNAAIDSARTALRLGAEEMTIIYRRTRAEMPASPEEIEEAIAEGVQIHYLAAPSRIMGQDGKVELECIRMELGEMDASGRRRPEPIKGSEFTMSFDTIIAAIGQRPDIPSQFDLAIGRENLIQVDPDTLATSREGVFAGGDVISGPASVIEAIAAGRRAAGSIDKFLGGDGDIEESIALRPDTEAYNGKRERGFADLKRVATPTIPLSERHDGFTEVDLCFDDDHAISEANRCLQCDLELNLANKAFTGNRT